MLHRKEIDGLRAVAVIPVVVFHAGLPGLPGGYVGVDVFFVISGYLITSIILAGRARGTFTFREFYERRTRRILPALVVMLAVTNVIAWFVLLPPAFRQFGASATAVVLFASNFYFLRTTDYFAAPTELVPLIHTWSLGVEEQFYLLFPVLAVVMARRLAIPLLVLLILASLGLAQWTSTAHPAEGFYMLPTRAWELLAGSLVAYASPHQSSVRLFRREALAILGLAGVVASYVLYDRSTPFPSLYAALPVAGTALVIAFATAETQVGRLLSWQPLEVVGLISYSTYLWHQPLLAFARHLSLNEIGAGTSAMLSVAAFVIGAASWHFIERPFRNRDWLTPRQVFSLAAGAGVLILALGTATVATSGFRNRFAPEALALLDQRESSPQKHCSARAPNVTLISQPCVLGNPHNVVGALIGDSHASALADGLDEALTASGIGLLQLTFHGCPPVPDVYRSDLGLDHDCAGFYREVRAHLEKSPNNRHIVIVSRWTRFINLTGFDNGEGGVETTKDRIAHLDVGKAACSNEDDRFACFRRKAIASVTSLLDLGKSVVLVYPVPEVGWEAPQYLMRRAVLKPSADKASPPASTSFAAFKSRNAATFAMLDAIGEHGRLARVYPHTAFCDTVLPGRCVFEQAGRSLYTDHNHLSIAGARLVAPDIVRAIMYQRQQLP
jgi:peptidoglycan/LPS O-acetylase OafA/YrhL